MPNASASEITISSGETEVMFYKKLDLKISLKLIKSNSFFIFYFIRKHGMPHILKKPMCVYSGSVLYLLSVTEALHSI